MRKDMHRICFEALHRSQYTRTSRPVCIVSLTVGYLIRLAVVHKGTTASSKQPTSLIINKVELGCNVTKGNGYFVSLQTRVVLTEWYNFLVNSEELTVTTAYLNLQSKRRINRRPYNGFRLYK
jgi:hypothetical protein